MNIIFALFALTCLISVVLGGRGKPNRLVNPQIIPVEHCEYADIQLAARYAHLSYCAKSETFAPFSCDLCDSSISPLEPRRLIADDSRKYEGFVGVNHVNKTIWFGFQGAVYIENWIASGDFIRSKLIDIPISDPSTRIKIRDSGARVHDGYLDTYLLIRDYAIANITEVVRAYPGYELHGVGHSYGCPLATLAAVDLVLNKVIDRSLVSLTTFGCPRVGNYEFASLLNQNGGLGLKAVRRVVHSFDIIVHYPPVPTGYRHHGTEYFVDVETKKMYKCEDVPQPNTRGGFDESPRCSNGLSPIQWKIDSHTSYFNSEGKDVCVVRGEAPTPVEYIPFRVIPQKK
ncbi:hypothetical protein HDV05_001805 [Chytridiales sp. JEL 0842]|nr:hypothetical protein HDV05_001805 [Chytridiales sp. JEL 0842]